MARLYQDGFEFNTVTANTNTWNLFTGATISTTHARTGTYGMRISSLTSATAQGSLFKWLSIAGSGPYYLRAYVYIVTLPSASNTIMNFNSNSGTVGAGNVGAIALESDGTITLRNSAGTKIGSASSAINDSTWHMVELKIDHTPASGSRVTEGRLDGNAFATSSSQTDGAAFAFSLGGNLATEAQTTGEWWFDDTAVNDSTGSFQTNYPSYGKILFLRPNASGDANSFATQTGGTAGSSNNFTRVNEVTPNDATTFNGSNTLNQQDLFNVDDSGIGSADTVNVVMVGGRFRNNTADATTALKFQIEKAASGTLSSSSAIVPNTTGWSSNAVNSPRNYPLVLHQDPDGTNWTKTTIDSMQIGYLLSTGGTNRVDVTNVWASVDYTPATVSATNSGFLGFM